MSGGGWGGSSILAQCTGGRVQPSQSATGLRCIKTTIFPLLSSVMRLTHRFYVICVITRHISSSAVQHSATWGRTREITAVQPCLHWPVSWREMMEERRAVPLEPPTPLIGSRSGTVSLPKVTGSGFSLAVQNKYTYHKKIGRLVLETCLLLPSFIFGAFNDIHLLCNLCICYLFCIWHLQFSIPMSSKGKSDPMAWPLYESHWHSEF